MLDFINNIVEYLTCNLSPVTVSVATVVSILGFIFGDMYRDGRFRRTSKMPYWTKTLLYSSAVLFAFLSTYYMDQVWTWPTLLSFVLLKKPISDYSYTWGWKGFKNRLYIGFTNSTDILIRKLLVSKNYRGDGLNKVRILYFFMIFVGICAGLLTSNLI